MSASSAQQSLAMAILHLCEQRVLKERKNTVSEQPHATYPKQLKRVVISFLARNAGSVATNKAHYNTSKIQTGRANNSRGSELQRRTSFHHSRFALSAVRSSFAVCFLCASNLEVCYLAESW
uniref:(northern house mosquito) hypothetical protein n=1 Tax=Culex pipiens TaxID=7175 RepID=A0A8D8BGT5_CULPI